MIARLPFPDSLSTLEDLLQGLGGVAPRRIRLRPFPGTATIKDLIRNKRCELVDGILVEKPMGVPESLLALFISRMLEDHVRPADLGFVTCPDGGYRLMRDLVRLPDVAFTAWERMPSDQVPTEAVAEVAPSLAVEVVSKGNTKSEMKRKRREYFQAGVEEVWMVDPVKRTVAIYTSEKESRLLGEDDTLDGSTVLPKFLMSLRTLFGELDRKRRKGK